MGHGLQRPEQCSGSVDLVDVQSNGGIHAPSSRYHDEEFYIITTNVYYNTIDNSTDFVNFIITADDVEGPWSNPHVLDGAPGIDPDIFFDQDGRVWYVGTHSPENPSFPGEGEIWLQEIDLKNWKLTGERSFLWRGACGGVWAEGPHLYRRDGRYYLLIAEGGTSFNHAVMVAVSDHIHGPYIPNDRNPILSSRHLSYDNWVVSTGHGDLVELADGRWFMVVLGVRGDVARGSNMGRETHLVPVIWEREPFEWKDVKYEWPVCAPLTGRVERVNPLPYPNRPQHRNDTFVDNFDSRRLDLEWNFRRVPREGTYRLDVRPGFLRLFAKPAVISERGRCSLMGIRQKESEFQYTVRMQFRPEVDGAEAGICLFQKDDNYLALTLLRESGIYILRYVLATHGASPAVIARRHLERYDGDIRLRLGSRDGRYLFSFSLDGGVQFDEFTRADAGIAVSRGYTGAYLGLYSTGNGSESAAYADFDWADYRGFPRLPASE